MALPFVIANLPQGNNPASDLDANYNAVAGMAVTTCTATGTNTLALVPAANQSPVTIYGTNQLFSFVPSNVNTGTVTININGIGAQALLKPGAGGGPSVLTGGELQTNQAALVMFDGTNFQLINPAIPAVFSTASYTELPNGVLYQWGSSGNTGNGTQVFFPKPFTVGCALVMTGVSGGLASRGPLLNYDQLTLSYFFWGAEVAGSVVTSGGTVAMTWIAIGV